jgi:diacylglycerol kinase family enzyme
MANEDVCVIFNPAAGRGRARGQLAQLQRALAGRARFEPSRGPGEMEGLALRAVADGYRVVAAAGGDGSVHEVANGVLRASRAAWPRPDVTFAVLPVGSANDYAYSLGLADDWWRRPDPAVGVRHVDVGVVRGGGRSRYFVNGLGLGFNGWVTVESRRIKHLRGMALYGLALLRALWSRLDAPPMTARFDDVVMTGPTLAVSVSLGQREGNFVVAPEARLDDGLFEWFRCGGLGLWRLLSFVPGLFVGRSPRHAEMRRGQCRRASIRSAAPLVVHADGELFCLPRDDVREIEIELLPGALPVLGRVDLPLAPQSAAQREARGRSAQAGKC